jgi:hypothetical protein
VGKRNPKNVRTRSSASKRASRPRARAYLDDDAVIGGVGILIAREHDVGVAVELPVDGRTGAEVREGRRKKRSSQKSSPWVADHDPSERDARHAGGEADRARGGREGSSTRALEGPAWSHLMNASKTEGGAMNMQERERKLAR